MKTLSIVSIIIVLILSLFIGFGGCSRNVDEVKIHASQVFDENGFKVIGYHGYQLSAITGGYVWYTLRRGNITYKAALCKWFDEYHLYNLKAIDAIKP